LCDCHFIEKENYLCDVIVTGHSGFKPPASYQKDVIINEAAVQREQCCKNELGKAFSQTNKESII